MGDYSFVVDSNFQPFSMQELLLPFTMYKEAYDKAEDKFYELSKDTSPFEYLKQTLPEESVARQIYEGYAKDLDKQASDLSKFGLSATNSRGLSSLKRRFQGEIGRLMKADEAMKEEEKLRQNLDAADNSRLYATPNLSLDDFLDGGNPNLYGVSGNALYAQGVKTGEANSKRVIWSGDKGKTVGGYYRDFAQIKGYSREAMAEFRNNMASIPELQQAVEDILFAQGVPQNLTGDQLERARKNVINGIIDGAIYDEVHNLVRDAGVMSAEEQDRSAQGWAEIKLSKEKNAMDYSLNKQRLALEKDKLSEDKKNGAVSRAYTNAQTRALENSGYDKSGKPIQAPNKVNRDVRNKNTIMVGVNTGQIYKLDGTEGEGIPLDRLPSVALSEEDYTKLVDQHGNISKDYARLRTAIGNGDINNYEIRKIPSGTANKAGTWGYMPWNWGNDDLDEDVYILVPRSTSTSATYSSNSEDSSAGTNDIPRQ